MSNKDSLISFNYIAIVNLLKTAVSTLERGYDGREFGGSQNEHLGKNEVKHIVNKLTQQLNLLIEEESN